MLMASFLPSVSPYNGKTNVQEEEMDQVEPSQTMPETEEVSDLRNRMEQYSTLNFQENRFNELIVKAEEHRHSVQAHVYQKVKEEYETKKVEIEKERENLENHLQENLQRFLATHDRILGRSAEQAERLEELNFRIRVGEFPEEEFAEEREKLKQHLSSHTEDLGRIEEILQEFTKVGLFEDAAKPPVSSGEHERQTREGKEALFLSSNEQHTERQEPDSVMIEPEGTVEEKQPSSLDEAPEESGDNQPETGFLVMEEDSSTNDEPCPVVRCPDTIPQTAHAQDTDSSRIAQNGSQDLSANGYVTGYLVAMEGSRQGDRFPMISSNITLGNSPGIDIRLDDGGISKFHARILYKEKKHYLENLDPMGRSFVNGIQADLIELKDGDVIRLGEIKFQVDYAPVRPD